MTEAEKAAAQYVLNELDPSDYVESAPDMLAQKVFLAGASWQREHDAAIALDICGLPAEEKCPCSAFKAYARIKAQT